jgi:hypothetical protein
MKRSAFIAALLYSRFAQNDFFNPGFGGFDYRFGFLGAFH